MNSFNCHFQKKKVVFIMGATGTGKSRLAVDIASRFPAEIINSDKIQVYKGLDVVTNKIPEAERRGVPHHLLAVVDPDSDFTVQDFCRCAATAVRKITNSGKIPIIAGGSNSYIEALVEDPALKLKAKYDCLFIWLDVSLPVLDSFVTSRVDAMVREGLVDEVRQIYKPNRDNNKGIRLAIGVPEMDKYFRAELKVDETTKTIILTSAVEEIKSNTCKLVRRQLAKIQRLRNELRWPIHHLDATRVFEKHGWKREEEWALVVERPCLEVVEKFYKTMERYLPFKGDLRSLVTN